MRLQQLPVGRLQSRRQVADEIQAAPTADVLPLSGERDGLSFPFERLSCAVS